jgi:hypothetical protein
LIYLGFVTEGKLAAIFIEPSLGVSNWPVIYFINYTPTSFLAPFITAPSTSFLAPLSGKKKISAREVSHAHSLLCFKFCFYFIFTCIVLSRTQKN